MDMTERLSAAEYNAITKRGNGTDRDDNAQIQFRNRVCSDRGRAFENLVMKGCQGYSLEGRAVINKVYEPYRCIKKFSGGKFSGQFTGRAEPDFKGVLCGGRAVAFECKSTRKTRIQRNVLTDQQMEWLHTQAKMGALTFVCVDISGRFFSVPWYVWHDMKDIYNKKFLMPSDILEYEVEYDGTVRFLDYVNGCKLDYPNYEVLL